MPVIDGKLQLGHRSINWSDVWSSASARISHILAVPRSTYTPSFVVRCPIACPLHILAHFSLSDLDRTVLCCVSMHTMIGFRPTRSQDKLPTEKQGSMLSASKSTPIVPFDTVPAILLRATLQLHAHTVNVRAPAIILPPLSVKSLNDRLIRLLLARLCWSKRNYLST
jgi:hypothetical protein